MFPCLTCCHVSVASPLLCFSFQAKLQELSHFCSAIFFHLSMPPVLASILTTPFKLLSSVADDFHIAKSLVIFLSSVSFPVTFVLLETSLAWSPRRSWFSSCLSGWCILSLCGLLLLCHLLRLISPRPALGQLCAFALSIPMAAQRICCLWRPSFVLSAASPLSSGLLYSPAYLVSSHTRLISNLAYPVCIRARCSYLFLHFTQLSKLRTPYIHAITSYHHLHLQNISWICLQTLHLHPDAAFWVSAMLSHPLLLIYDSHWLVCSFEMLPFRYTFYTETLPFKNTS